MMQKIVGWKRMRAEEPLDKRTGAATWECTAPVHICGYCPHPSNHLRRRIHQPSLLPRNIHRNDCAAQEVNSEACWSLKFPELLLKSDEKRAIRLCVNRG